MHLSALGNCGFHFPYANYWGSRACHTRYQLRYPMRESYFSTVNSILNTVFDIFRMYYDFSSISTFSTLNSILNIIFDDFSMYYGLGP